jgi:hypothetical protein
VAVANAVVENVERTGLRCRIALRNVTPGVCHAGQIIHAKACDLRALGASRAVILELFQCVEGAFV